MTAFSVTDAAYAKGKKILRVFDNIEGMKGRCAYLAEALGGRWVHRSKGYSMSPAAVEKFRLLYAAGFEGHIRSLRGQTPQFYHSQRGLQNLSAAKALKLAKEKA